MDKQEDYYPEHDCSHLEKALNPENVQQIKEKGYTIVDNFLGQEWSEKLLADCKNMAQKGFIKQHFFQFGESLYQKPNIFEVDLHDRDLRENSKELSYIFEAAGPHLVQTAKKNLPHLDLGSCPSAIKMQWNKGSGGCFPSHYDNPGKPNKRKLTCVIYLNPNWKEGDGGEIKLWPFLEKPITVAPKMDRAVFFQSDLILHRVMPSNVERFCFSIWCDGNNVNSDEDTLLTGDKLKFTSYDQAAEFFKKTPLQRVLSRSVYEEEYKESLLQCVGGTPAEKPMLASHIASSQAIYSKLKPLIDEFRKRKNGEVTQE